MQYVTIPEGVTKIGARAFENDTALQYVTIYASVKTIGSNAFFSCTKLNTITFKGTKSLWNSISKEYNWNSNTGRYTVRCTDGNLSK